MKWTVAYCAAVFASLAAGQTIAPEQSMSHPRLANGASVYYQTWREVTGYRRTTVRDIEVLDNAVVRKLVNDNGAVWFGYQVHFDKIGDTTFRVSFSSIPGIPFFEKAPEAREIQDGERVMTNVLEEPSTGRRAFDIFQVCLPGTAGAYLPLPNEGAAPGVIPSGTALRLSHPRFSRGSGLVQSRDSNVSMDAHVSMNVPNLGRFMFSSSPGAGYKLEALAEGNTLRFMAGTDECRIEADAPFTDQAGAWFLWVKFEPATGPVTSAVVPKTTAAKSDGPAPIELMATPAPPPESGAPAGWPAAALSVQVKNVSTKNILAYSFQTFFTDPNTGRTIGQRGSNATFINVNTDQADPMPPGGTKGSGRFVPLPQNAPGVQPRYSFSVDLVIFDDGSTWGPGTAVGSDRMLQNVKLWLANHKKDE